MKKSLFCTLALTALSCVSLCWIHHTVDASRDQITLTPIRQTGDPAAAEQVQLRFVSNLDERLFWDTTAVPGQSAETDFTYLKKQYNYIPEDDTYHIAFQLPFNTGGTGSWMDERYMGSVAPLLNEVAGRTAPGTVHTEILRTRDYFPELPLELRVRTPGDYYDPDFLKFQLEEADLPEEEQALYQQQLDFQRGFARVFRFPTPEDHQIAISIGKTEDGTPESFLISEDIPTEPVPDRSIFSEEPVVPLSSCWIETRSHYTQTEDAFYFIPMLVAADGSLLDYSLTPGYGLYRLDLTQEPLSVEGLSLVLPLEEDQQINSLMTDSTGARLLLTTVTEDRATLHLLDAATGALRQSIPLGPVGSTAGDDGPYLYYGCLTDGPLLVVKDSLGGFRLFVLQADGTYRFYFDGTFPDDPIFREGHQLDYRLTFDGKTLAYAARVHMRDSYGDHVADTTQLPLLLWNTEGLRYSGVYRSSLDQSPELNYSRRIEPFTPMPLELTFRP